MISSPLDFGVVHAHGERSFGAPIGIMLLDCTAPMIPGSVGNASTYTAPVKYRSIPDLTVEQILSSDASRHCDRVVQVARALATDGAQVITTNCGFTARYQQAVQSAVDVPVLLSSLLLVPFLQSMLPTHRKLGIITASSPSVTPEFVADTGISWDTDRVRFAGLEDAPAFAEAYLTCTGQADIPAIHDEVVRAAEALVAQDPAIGCLLLECSELPPYSAAVQQSTRLPVFDFTSMIEFFVAGLRRTVFTGFV